MLRSFTLFVCLVDTVLSQSCNIPFSCSSTTLSMGEELIGYYSGSQSVLDFFFWPGNAIISGVYGAYQSPQIRTQSVGYDYRTDCYGVFSCREAIINTTSIAHCHAVGS